MTIYEKNIQTLSRYYPGMDYNIDKAKHELKENYTIIEEKSNDGMPVLKVKKGWPLLLSWRKTQCTEATRRVAGSTRGFM